MKTRAFLFCFAATALLASCSLEPNGPENVIPDGITELRVGLTETKTILGDKEGTARKVYWADGDMINVNGVNSQALTGVAEKSTSAVFTLNDAVTSPLNVLYPAAFYHGAGEITMPAVQDYVAGGFASGSLPMAGSGDSVSEVALKHLCAVLRLSILKSSAAGADEDEIASVSFKGNAGEQVCGVFSLDNAAGILTGLSSDAADQTVTLSGINASLDASTPLDVYLVVPAREYASGFTVTVTDSQGHSMARSLNQSKELVAGIIYLAGEFAFEPASAVDLNITINSAEDLVALAQAWNNNDYNGAAINVTLGSDISFNSTTNAAYKATGGIGNKGVDDAGDAWSNYFHGVFDGKGKTISGFAAGVPLFAYTGDECTIKDLTLDASCNLEFTPNNETDCYFGAVAGYHKGAIENVNVKASVSLAALSDVGFLTALGGIVGRATIGTVSNSHYSGTITVPAGFTSKKKVLVGGLVGYISNMAGAVSGSSFDGNINYSGLDARTGGDSDSERGKDRYNPYTIIGGIVGFNTGAVSDCSTTDHPDSANEYESSNGTIFINSTNTYNTAIGGIVGENAQGKEASGSVANCTNGASLFTKVFKGENDDAGDWAARYLRTGGIVGYNRANASVTGCTNTAAVTHRSDPRLQSLAGIVGYNEADGIVSGCTNSGAITVSSTKAGAGAYSARLPYFGGVIGENYSSEISDLHNTAEISISRTENGTKTEVRMGGVIGNNRAAINGGSGKFTNSGKVYFNTNVSKQALKYNVGGVVGYSDASISNAENSGYVLMNWNSDANVLSLAHIGGVLGYMDVASDVTSLSNCKNIGGNDNAGEVYLAVKKGAAAHNNNYAGGILGYGSGKKVEKVNDEEVITIGGVSITNCSNSGYVHGGNSNKVNGNSCYMGGIAAYIGHKSSVSNCTNTGKLLNDQFNNTVSRYESCYEGGIVGFADGTAEDRISVTGVTNTVNGVGPRRGYGGGAVGYAMYTDVKNATNTGDYTGGSCYYLGGIVGGAEYSTITGCTYNGATIQTSQIIHGGGIIATMLGNCVVDDCRSYVTTINKKSGDTISDATKAGALAAGGSEGGNDTVKNSHYKSGLPAFGDENIIDGGGNAADL